MLEGQKVIVGFRRSNQAAFYFGEDPVFQLNSVWLSVACITVDRFIELSQVT